VFGSQLTIQATELRGLELRLHFINGSEAFGKFRRLVRVDDLTRQDRKPPLALRRILDPRERLERHHAFGLAGDAELADRAE
jgi:hypothetical protein